MSTMPVAEPVPASVPVSVPLTPLSATGDLTVLPGPGLLSHLAEGPSLLAHRQTYGPLPTLGGEELAALCESVNLQGRGGAGFPFARKLRTVLAQRRRPVVVVNASEGEPVSAKDAALAQVAPHLILDGAVLTAKAIRAGAIHVVTSADAPAVGMALRRAVGERNDPLSVCLHETEAGFVGGQARAVLDLIAGGPGLPVTSAVPEAISGLRGRPTLLSNAETWAHVARLALRGTTEYSTHGAAQEPGTTLLTVGADTVCEVEFGTPLGQVIGPHDGPVLLGGFHGSWLRPEEVPEIVVSTQAMRQRGTPLGAGVVMPISTCPVAMTATIVDYLAGQSARRCGPCRLGLPALAAALAGLAAGQSDGQGDAQSYAHRVGELVGLLPGRGACAHPDGTARLARSLLMTYGDEVSTHIAGACSFQPEVIT